MNSFNAKQDKKSVTGRAVILALLFLALIFAVLYVVTLNSSLGWFAQNRRVGGRNMQVGVESDTYDLLVERGTEYDTVLLGGDDKYPGIDTFKAAVAALGYSFTATSTETSSEISFELVNEVATRSDGVDYYYLNPGACGTLTIYLKPKSGVSDVVAHLDISIGGYVNEYENDVLVLNEMTSATALDLLKGHILFFTERTGASQEYYKYNGLITDGLLTYDTSQHAKSTKPGKTDCYEITLYWEWPVLYQNIYDMTGAAAFDDRYPPELTDYVDDNREYFFASIRNTNDLDVLNDEYNDGDQAIGENADFITVTITPIQ
ncbi:MAG: hypothetical protein IKZ47_06460 [Clostridia bacterium]|nr:hypothetical protein [Clostridia bacterium]